MTGSLPGKVISRPARRTKADGVGNITDLDVFAIGSPTTQARHAVTAAAAPGGAGAVVLTNSPAPTRWCWTGDRTHPGQ
jgi:hypothetical protein